MSLSWCFTAIWHFSGHFRRGQLTYPQCSWASLLGSLPVLSAHSFPSNWQLSFLNQPKGENGRRNYFMTNVHERMLLDVRIEPAIVRIPGGRLSDRANVWLNGQQTKVNKIRKCYKYHPHLTHLCPSLIVISRIFRLRIRQRTNITVQCTCRRSLVTSRCRTVCKWDITGQWRRWWRGIFVVHSVWGQGRITLFWSREAQVGYVDFRYVDSVVLWWQWRTFCSYGTCNGGTTSCHPKKKDLQLPTFV